MFNKESLTITDAENIMPGSHESRKEYLMVGDTGIEPVASSV